MRDAAPTAFTAGDIGRDRDGDPVRPYRYMTRGFYRDAALTERGSVTDAVDGDTDYRLRQLTQASIYLPADGADVCSFAAQASP